MKIKILIPVYNDFQSVSKLISDINSRYLEEKKLEVTMLGRGFTWLGTGTHDSLLEASHFVQTIENSQGFKIACLEEISLNNKWITKKEIVASIKFYGNCQYSKYLKKIIT